jgi:hypothetical protein
MQELHRRGGGVDSHFRLNDDFMEYVPLLEKKEEEGVKVKALVIGEMETRY